MDGFEYVTGAELFDYSAEAEVFSRTSGKALAATAWVSTICTRADAIRFVIEELSPQLVGNRNGYEMAEAVMSRPNFISKKRPPAPMIFAIHSPYTVVV